MIRISLFIAAFIIVGDFEATSALSLVPGSNYVIHVADNHTSCSRKDAEQWANAFVSCFVNRGNLFKTRRDLFNIVARLLDRSKRCIKFSTLECRPNYEGFLIIMGKVIEMIKEYSNMHVERLTKAGFFAYPERADKIMDLNCVENLTKDTYASCFSRVTSVDEELGKYETYDLIYENEVDMAILCTDAAKRQCSKSVTVDLNKVVRYILGVKQPEREYIEHDHMATNLPRHIESAKPQSELRKTGTEFTKLEDLNSTEFHDSKDFDDVFEEEDLEIYFFTLKAKSIASTESPKILEQFKASTHVHLRTKFHDLQFTDRPELLKDTVIQKLKDPTNSTDFDASKGHVVAENREDRMTELATADFEEEFTAYTKFPRLIEHPKTTESTKPPISTNHPKTDTSAKPPKPTDRPRPITSTNPPIFTDHPKTDTSTKPPKPTDRPRPITSTKPPKPTDRPRPITSTKPPKLTESSRNVASTRLPKPTERQRTTTSPKHPSTTERSRTSASTKSPKSTERPRTTTTTRPRTSSSSLRSRSKDDDNPRSREDSRPWHDDNPRPTEAPRPWYDFIVRPFVSLWRTIKSWFGW